MSAKPLADAATSVTNKAAGTAGEATPSGQLRRSLEQLAQTLALRALTGVSNKVSGTTERLNQVAQGGGAGLVSTLTGGGGESGDGGRPLSGAVRAGKDLVTHTVAEKLREGARALTGGFGKKAQDKSRKPTNIVEQIDVGVPVDLAYDQWTRFTDFPSFMKKVENVDQVSDEKLKWSGKVFWSKRTWESTIVEQVPFERIVWRSSGDKGFIDGAVSFHELAPDLTRIMVVLDYHPAGLFEKTANLWRAAGRRVRLELKLFQRHVMTEAVLHPDDVVGWHGEIRDGEVVEDDGAADEDEDADVTDDTDDTDEAYDTDDTVGEEAFDDEEFETDEAAGDESDDRPQDSPAARRRTGRVRATAGREARR